MRRARTLLALGIAAALAVPVASNGADGILSTFAGTTPGFAGDGAPADQALLNQPRGMALMGDGTVLVADSSNHRVRRVAPNGIITTVVGDGTPAFFGDGGAAFAAQLDTPTDVLGAPDGGYWIADSGNNRIRRVAPDGTITTFAGSGSGPGLGGDGGPATAARLSGPRELSLMPDGAVLIVDTGNHRLRRVGTDGIITTVAGTTQGRGGDGGPATAAQLSAPTGAAVMPDGGMLIADTGNNVVRRISAAGVIATVAGVGPAGFAGDGDPARLAALAAPADVAALGANGGYLVIDGQNNRVRRITPLGAIFTISGGGPGLGGDGGPASAGLMRAPQAIQFAPGGGVLVADTGNSRVRKLSDVGQIPAPVRARSLSVTPVSGNVVVRPTGTPTAIPLREPDLAPHLSQVDARAGKLTVGVRDLKGAPASADVSGGQFRLDSPPTGAVIADLRLNEPLACSKAKSTKATAKKTRRLRIRVKGRYRTIGTYASAVASGTAWTITDACDRTVVKVTEGTVIVRNRRNGRYLTVKAGQRRTILKSGKVLKG